MSRSIELTDDEIELIEEAIAELPTSELLTGVKAKLIRAAEPAAEATHTHAEGESAT